MNIIENLIENVDNQIIKIRTKSLDVSFNELYDMYKDGELIISPDYQRLFRWGAEKQSRFVESLLLEMPVPPIFVIETGEGVYELIDGLQRISSYLHFRGEQLLGNLNSSGLVLDGCDIVSDLNGLKFNDLPKALQIKMKRSFVRMEVIRKESEAALKYYMFKRLNTGGELLSEQEIRNCTIRLLDSTAINFIEECSQNKDFQNAIRRVGEDKLNMRYDQELVVRFFAIKNDIDNYRYPVNDYLTRFLEKVTEQSINFDYNKERFIFNATFSFINRKFGSDAFSGRKISGEARNEFIHYYFDAITIPISILIEALINRGDNTDVIELIEKLKYSETLMKHKTGSVDNVKARIKIFMEGVQNILDC